MKTTSLILISALALELASTGWAAGLEWKTLQVALTGDGTQEGG